jgi:hypothetical protein
LLQKLIESITNQTPNENKPYPLSFGLAIACVIL